MKKLGMLKKYTSKEIKDSTLAQLLKPEKCYELLGKTGVKFARCQIGWVRCETRRGSTTLLGSMMW